MSNAQPLGLASLLFLFFHDDIYIYKYVYTNTIYWADYIIKTGCSIVSFTMHFGMLTTA